MSWSKCTLVTIVQKATVVMLNIYVPPTRRVGGYIVFGADPVSVGICFFISMHDHLNYLMDLDQTCIDTLLGGGGELIRFW